ncbi:AtsE [Devosia limi DSM 17137]|uniref:AtsE n=1 Tax=Devosia limi DSM 17137 TaxID=1121477 RepID=A0A0F5LUT6_9HYPH|nr:host attachment protein [Devosia limi]KKB86088.1 AtsE [Devosia limi DSM 17137]SHF84761.1 Protein required for attachment to host cells [Devosia limi DSM 17137]
MMLPKGTTIAVADVEKLNLFRNSGDEAGLNLTPAAHPGVDEDIQGSGSRQNSTGNPDKNQAAEDGFAAGIVALLNRGILEGKIDGLVIIAAPRALGEMRKHYHKALTAKLLGEIAKDLTGHPISDIETAIRAA